MPPLQLSLVLVSALFVVVIVAFSLYNGLIRSQKRVQEAWSGIDVHFRRRASLVPNLVEVVKGYAAHEREVFQDVASARGALQQASGAGQAANANNMLSQALARIFAVVENYPQLRGSENFMSLRADLNDVEDKIAFARQFYNRNVLDYNTRIETYPTAFVANLFSFASAEFFEADDEGRAEVRVSFAQPPARSKEPAVPPAT